MNSIEPLRSSLKSQYHAALAMLREAIEKCPEDLWLSKEYTTAYWQLAYHTLFITHLYCQTQEEAFKPWKYHVSNVQYPDGVPGDPDPNSTLPLIPDPYSKSQVLEYCQFCEDNVNGWIDLIDLFSEESGFSWYKIPKVEHQIVNIRHIEHGAAQLAHRLRVKYDVGVKWVGARRSK